MSPTPETGSAAAPTARSDARVRSARSQLTRLFRIVLFLQGGGHPNARDLSEHCEVSRRTIYRDLDLLAASGVPVAYHRERRGYGVAPEFFLPPRELEEAEVFALLVSSRHGQGLSEWGLSGPARAGALKLTLRLPDELRRSLLARAEAFHEAPEGGRMGGRGSAHTAILRAIAEGQQVRVWYDAPGEDDAVCTKLSPYRVVEQGGTWYVVGRSTFHRRVEAVPLARVGRVVPTTDRFVTPPRFDPRRFLPGQVQETGGAAAGELTRRGLALE